MHKALRHENKDQIQYATPDKLGEFLHDVVNILLSGPASANKGADLVGVFQEEFMQEAVFGVGHRLCKTGVSRSGGRLIRHIHAWLNGYKYQ